MYPADFGRAFSCSNIVERDGRPFRADCGLAGLELMTDEMLPETEWVPLTVDMELSVSDEIVDNGRGINSTVSENPTLVRVGGLVGGDSSLAALGFSSEALEEMAGWDARRPRICGGTSDKEGVVGALDC